MNLISQNISIDQKLILAIIPKFKVLKTHHEKITATTAVFPNMTSLSN